MVDVAGRTSLGGHRGADIAGRTSLGGHRWADIAGRTSLGAAPARPRCAETAAADGAGAAAENHGAGRGAGPAGVPLTQPARSDPVHAE
jgi:hypothetical protein